MNDDTNENLRVTAWALASWTMLGCTPPDHAPETGGDSVGSVGTTTGSALETDDEAASTSTGAKPSMEASDPDSSTGDETCALSTLPLPGEFYPEGICAAADGSVYAASFATGQIVRFAPCDDQIQHFAQSTQSLGPTGNLVDPTAGVLWTCVSDLSGAATAALVGFDLDDGSERTRHEVAPGGWCGDLEQAPDGTIYVTDPALNTVYRLDAATLLDAAPMTVWLDDPILDTEDGSFGLNDAALTSAGLILNHANGSLYRISIEPDGSAGSLVSIALPRPLEGADGLDTLDDQRLLAVENVRGEVSLIELTDDSATLTTLASGLMFPTTLAIVGSRAWVTEGQLNTLLDPESPPPTLPFELIAIELP